MGDGKEWFSFFFFFFTIRVPGNRLWHKAEGEFAKKACCVYEESCLFLKQLICLVCFLLCVFMYFFYFILYMLIVCLISPFLLPSLGLQTLSGVCWRWSWCWCWLEPHCPLPGSHSPVWAESLTSRLLQVVINKYIIIINYFILSNQWF